MWEAWETGQTPHGYDVYDNEYGKTYAWYAPLNIQGTKLGLIGTEEKITDYNHAIAMNTLRQLVAVSIVLVLTEVVVLTIINRSYISRIRNLTEGVTRYARDKEAKIAREIERDKGHDEISVLGRQTASMILEIDNYMRSVVEMSEELSQTREHVEAIAEFATKDALTGILNSNVYENELLRLDALISAGNAAFGIAVIDLNFLKRMNDTYGHERGNSAIRACCDLVCETFAHSPVYRIGGDEFSVILNLTSR